MSIKKFMIKICVNCVAIVLTATSINTYADAFGLVTDSLETQLATEGYTTEMIQQMTKSNVPAARNLREYLKSSCLSRSKVHNGGYVGAQSSEYTAFSADGTFEMIINSAAWAGGSINGINKGRNVVSGYWNTFQGAAGQMYLALISKGQLVGLKIVRSYDLGALSFLNGLGERVTFRRTPNSSC